MNDDERGNELPISEAPTDPGDNALPSPGQGWKMPEPKFQQSSGYLPQGYLEKIGFEAPMQSSVSAAAATAPAAAPLPDVEPQPDLSEQLDAQPQVTVPPKPAARERSSGSRVLMIVLGLLAMAAFIAVFLGVVYYLFLAPQNGGSPF